MKKNEWTEIPQKPYLIRALYEWCTDNGYTPHVAVKVDAHTQVPREFVRDDEIVLNISFGATSGLTMDNEAIQFKARFGGVSRDLYVPIARVMAIYAQENGQGMGFEISEPPVDTPSTASPQSSERESSDDDGSEPEKNTKKSQKPLLKIVK